MNRFKSKRKLAVCTVVLALLAGACGGSGDDGALPPLEELEDSTTSTDSTSTTTTTAPTSTSSSTTTTVVEAPLSDRERPELEVQTEWDSDLEEIFGRYLLYWEAYYTAAGPPFADPSYQPLLDILDPGILDAIQAQIQEFVDANALFIRPPDTLDEHGLRLPNPSVLEKTEGNRVVIQDCWIKDDITLFLDDGSEVEHFWTTLWNVDMIVIGGEWRVFAVNEADERSDGYQECQDLFDTLEK